MKKVITHEKFTLWFPLALAVVGGLIALEIASAAGAGFGWGLAIMAAGECLSAWGGLKLAWALQERYEEDADADGDE